MWILFLFLCQINLFFIVHLILFILKHTIYNVQIPIKNWLNYKFKIPIRYNILNESTPIFSSFIIHLLLLISGWTIHNIQIPVINWLNSKFKIPIKYNLVKEYIPLISSYENEENQSDFNKITNDINTEEEFSDDTDYLKQQIDNILFDESLD
jgi:hypothetical protein